MHDLRDDLTFYSKTKAPETVNLTAHYLTKERNCKKEIYNSSGSNSNNREKNSKMMKKNYGIHLNLLDAIYSFPLNNFI